MRWKKMPAADALDVLSKALSYDPETGRFVWLIGPRPGIRAGDEAGTFSNGYRDICYRGEHIGAHRLAWLFAYREWPRWEVDHINGDRADNRICNLRDVTTAMNTQNQLRPTVRSKTRFMGVSFCGSRFRAAIYVNGRTKHLGRFETPEAAHEAYVTAKRELHPGCTL